VRFVDLQLLAFGPFTNTSLTFSEGPALHLIYGPNEAGKSTALRAITGLLYGIPATTGDAHLHRTSELRIGARLANARRSLAVLRRKGNKNTLLDHEGGVLPEDALDEFLCGIDEATFRAMFGLDHESLRRGAEALLRGKGNVGESLFDAGVGGRGIQLVLEELTREADALYRPRGQTQKINEALRELRQAQKRRADAELSAEAWQAQIDAIESDRAERETLVLEQRRLAAEANSLRRALRALPLVAKLRELRERRADLGTVKRLAADARPRRLAAQRVAEECGSHGDRLRGEIERLVAAREQVRVADALAELDESLAEDLRNRLGEQRKAAVDLPKRQGELEAIGEEISALVRRLGADAERYVAGERLQPAAQTRILKLANERSGVRAALDLGRRHLSEQAGKMALLREAIGARVPAPDTRALQRALSAAAQVVDLPAQQARLRRRWERECEDVSRDAASLGLRVRSVAELRAVVLPGPEVVERLATRLESLERRLEECDVRARDLGRRERQNERDRAALDNAGAVPSEEALAVARRRREALWTGLRALIDSRTPADEALREYEASVRAADDLADRLRREAERVAQRGALLADREALRGERDALVRESEALAAERSTADGEWQALWAAVPVEVAPPGQVRGWLRRCEELFVRVRRADDLREQVEEAETVLRERCESLHRELSALAGEAVAGEDLALLMEKGSALVQGAADSSRRQEEEGRALAELRREVEASQRRVAECEAQLADWEDAWRGSVAILGLGGAATPEEVQAVLEQHSTLYARLDEMSRMEKRIAALEDDARRFASDVNGYVEARAPTLRDLPPLEMAEQFLRLQRRAVTDLRERERIGREIEERRAALDEQDARRAQARRQLDLLLAEAAVPSLEALEECEARSVMAADLDDRLAELGDQLLSVGEGASLEELVDQVGATDSDIASARLREVDALLEQLNERQRVLDTQIGRNESGLEYMQRERGAAQAAAEVEEKLATLAEHVQRYVRVKLAIAMLEREVERYRRENQGPVLTRASDLFPRLTLGRYTALRVGFDGKDEAVLRCLRNDGVEVDVEGLSDGTRDQLYLALRLATLEKFAESNEPMPFIVDDILIHFDDDRARASFEVLGEFATTTQVLFFTHNARLRDLAREVVPPDRLVEHDLSPQGLLNTWADSQ